MLIKENSIPFQQSISRHPQNVKLIAAYKFHKIRTYSLQISTRWDNKQVGVTGYNVRQISMGYFKVKPIAYT